MRITEARFLVGLLICLCGCATDQFKPGSGDARTFILQRAVAAGAAPVSTNAPLRVTGGWRYFEDQNGAVIRMAPHDYPAVESFLIQTFGQPRVGPEDTSNGGKYGTYRLTAKGGVLQFGRDAEDGTHIEIIRPLTREEAGDAAARALSGPEAQRGLAKP